MRLEVSIKYYINKVSLLQKGANHCPFLKFEDCGYFLVYIGISLTQLCLLKYLLAKMSPIMNLFVRRVWSRWTIMSWSTFILNPKTFIGLPIISVLKNYWLIRAILGIKGFVIIIIFFNFIFQIENEVSLKWLVNLW